MLNEEKIRLMTGIAMFEKKAEKEVFPVTRYFKSDYVGGHMLRSFVMYTVTCLIGLIFWILYHINEILDTMDMTVLWSSAKYLAVLYAAGLILYLMITYHVYAERYDVAAKNMKIYQAKLRRLGKKYGASGVKEDEEEWNS